jgi:hypothetical protein
VYYFIEFGDGRFNRGEHLMGHAALIAQVSTILAPNETL